jgi:hypothetical protein
MRYIEYLHHQHSVRVSELEDEGFKYQILAKAVLKFTECSGPSTTPVYSQQKFVADYDLKCGQFPWASNCHYCGNQPTRATNFTWIADNPYAWELGMVQKTEVTANSRLIDHLAIRRCSMATGLVYEHHKEITVFQYWVFIINHHIKAKWSCQQRNRQSVLHARDRITVLE